MTTFDVRIVYVSVVYWVLMRESVRLNSGSGGDGVGGDVVVVFVVVFFFCFSVFGVHPLDTEWYLLL